MLHPLLHCRKVALLVAACSVCLPAIAQGQLRAQVVATGLAAPVAFLPDPAFANTFYIVESGGVIKVLRNGQLQAEPFLDIRDATDSGGERGLLGMAFSPDAASGRFFLNFTNTNGDTVVARFRRTAATPFRGDKSSRFDLRWPSGERVIRQPFANHNGGHLAFGPDGYLYIGLGDGGGSNDPQNNAQNPATLLGKMLRIDVNVSDADAAGYRVPADNPFLDGQPVAALGEIWAFGLRNPWRYSFDDVGAGASRSLIIADVGQGQREEISLERPGDGGRNYGWRLREGRIATPGIGNESPAYGPLTDPIYDYERTVGRSITGGFVYRGTLLPAAYRGRYFYGDFVTSRVFSLGLVMTAQGTVVATDVLDHTSELGGSLGGVASFGRDLTGELYVVTFAGRILQITAAAPSGPGAPQHLNSSVIGSTVTLAWTSPTGAIDGYQIEAGASTGDASLAVLPLAGTQTSATVTGVPAGTYFVRVRSRLGNAVSTASNEVTVTVGASCAAPAAPTNLTFTIAARLVTLSWNANATGVDRFLLEAGNASGLTDIAIPLSSATRSVTVQAPPGRYFVRLRAGSPACGVSPASNELLITVP